LIERLGDRFGFVQVGRADYGAKDIEALHAETSIREALALVWASDIFVGFDSGFAHAAAAFQRPSIVLWDAVHKAAIEERKDPGFALASLSRWGYPFNKNILLLGEKESEALNVLIDCLLDFRRRNSIRHCSASDSDSVP
jgi:ADP-heptose:LPS heptosyltransferase